MYDEKIEGLLSLAMEQTPSERLNNPDFAETKNDLVEVIVKYSGGLASLRQANPNWNILELLSEYASLSFRLQKWICWRPTPASSISNYPNVCISKSNRDAVPAV